MKENYFAPWNRKNITAIIFDDEESSVAPHRKILQSIGIESFVINNLSELKYSLISRENIVLFVDMHMSGINDFSEISLPQVKTGRGESVGIAVIRGLLPNIDRIDVPAFVLSGYELSNSAKKQMIFAKQDNMHIDYIRKEDTEKFENNVKSTVTLLEKEFSRRDFLAAEMILKEWLGSDPEQISLAFGYLDTSKIEWSERRTLILNDFTQDIKTRSSLIVYIKECLVKIYGEDDISKEIAWLREKDRFLPDETSPWDCIFSGWQHSLAAVAGLLAKIVD